MGESPRTRKRCHRRAGFAFDLDLILNRASNIRVGPADDPPCRDAIQANLRFGQRGWTALNDLRPPECHPATHLSLLWQFRRT